MTRLWVAATAGLAAVSLLATALAAQAQRRIDPAALKLPDGDGKLAVIEYCTGACHPAARFVDMRQSPAEWHKTVMLMVAFGAQLFPEDVDTVTNYLGTYLSKSATPQDAK
jgi:hypothetical protein